MFEKIKEKTIKLLFGMLKMETIVVTVSIIGMGTLEVIYLILYSIVDSVLGVITSSSNFKFISNLVLLIYMISRCLIYITGGEILSYYLKIITHIILTIITLVIMVFEMNYHEERGEEI